MVSDIGNFGLRNADCGIEGKGISDCGLRIAELKGKEFRIADCGMRNRGKEFRMLQFPESALGGFGGFAAYDKDR
jgi:hypothetical protein